MKVVKRIAPVLAAIGMVTAPIVAQAAPAELSRTSVGIEGEQQAGGFPFLIIFAVIAVGLGLYFALDDGGDDEPASP